MKELPLLYVLVFCCTLSQSLKLPDYITPCRRDDPNFNACALKSAREAIPHMLNGDPKYNTLPLDPIPIKKSMITQTSSSISLTMTAHDVQMTGLKNVDIRGVNIDFDNDKITIDFYIPQIQIHCVYNVTGRVLLLPIDGTLNATIVPDKVVAKYTFIWEHIKKNDGKEYLIPTQSKLTFQSETYSVALTNFYHGNTLLRENINRFLKENWKHTLKKIGPAIAQGLGKYIEEEVIGGIFQLVPSENVYLHDR